MKLAIPVDHMVYLHSRLVLRYIMYHIHVLGLPNLAQEVIGKLS